jgi:hypothetical protein
VADDDPGEYRELTADDLAERWKPEPFASRPVVRTRYAGPDGTSLILEHPQVVPPPTIDLHDVDLGALRFVYQGPA